MNKIRRAMGLSAAAVLLGIVFFGSAAAFGAERGTPADSPAGSENPENPGISGTREIAEEAKPENSPENTLYGGSRVILSFTGDPAHSRTVSWTAEGGGPGYVKWAPAGKPFSDENMAKAAAVKTGKYPKYRYEARIGGLSGDTVYRYVIGNGLYWSQPGTFRTAPDSRLPRLRNGGKNQPETFLYFGDVQFAQNRKNAEKWQGLLMNAYEENPSAGFGLFGGDLVNRGGSAEEWETFFHYAEPVFSHIPLMAAAGNHEAESPPLYRDMLALPENGPESFPETFYYFDYGNSRILSLDSSVLLKKFKLPDSRREEIRRWIKNALRESGARWKIVMLHHPPYGASDKGGIYGKIRREWCSIFSEEGADLVLCGHQHLYLRTEEIDGVTYIMGNSGSRRSRYFQGDNVPEYIKRVDADSSSYQVISAGEKELSVTSCGRKGQIIDRWTKKADPPPHGGKVGILAAVILGAIFVRIFWWRPNTEPGNPY